MKNDITDTKTNIGSTSEKCPEMSQLMETIEGSRLKETVENDALLKLLRLDSFQERDNEDFSRVSDTKGPVYRKIDKYTKSIEQYWKERNRRKQAWLLSSKDYTYTQIAKKLGVSEKTVQRDIKKVSRYYIGQLNRSWRIMEEERQAEWAKKIEGLSLTQQFKLVTAKLGDYLERKRGREYKRHLLKLIIDMDDLKHGVFPTIKPWPSHKHFSVTLPLHVQFILRANGQNMKYGGFTIG